MERKTVRFVSDPEISVKALVVSTRGVYSSPSNEEEDISLDDATREFIAPTICSLCSSSISAVSMSVDTNYSNLLLTMVRLYANRTLIKAVFSSLESNQAHLIKEYRGEKILKKKLLILCMILSKAARFEKGLVDHPEFTANILETILLLLQCDLVDTSSSNSFFSELIKVIITIVVMP